MQFSGSAPVSLFPPPETGEGEGGYGKMSCLPCWRSASCLARRLVFCSRIVNTQARAGRFGSKEICGWVRENDSLIGGGGGGGGGEGGGGGGEGGEGGGGEGGRGGGEGGRGRAGREEAQRGEGGGRARGGGEGRGGESRSRGGDTAARGRTAPRTRSGWVYQESLLHNGRAY